MIDVFAFLKPQETASNRKSTNWVLRMVFKSLETFSNRFNFSTLQSSQVKRTPQDCINKVII